MNRFERQADLISCDMNTPITIVGAGGIGSFLALTLAKMGFVQIDVWDFDKVEDHNLPNQFYREQDIGQFKVVALADIIQQFTGTRIRAHAVAWDAQHEDYVPTEVLLSAVDSMEVRSLMYRHAEECEDVRWLLDGRMGGTQIEVYTVDMECVQDIRMYESKLWTDAETAPLRCTMKATMFTVLTIASFMSNNLVKALSRMDFKNNLTLDMTNMGLLYVRPQE